MSLFLLFCGVLLSTIPSHVMSLAEYLITREQLDLTLYMKQFVRSLLNSDFVTDVGHMLLGCSSCLLVPSTVGYFGAVRESRLLLFLVRHGISLGVCIILSLSFSTLHLYWYYGACSLSFLFFSQPSHPCCTDSCHGLDSGVWLPIGGRGRRPIWYLSSGIMGWLS